MSRAYGPIVRPGRVYVPRMDVRGLDPEEAHIVREHVLTLRRYNLDAERREIESRGEGWSSYLAQRLVLVVAGFVVGPMALFCGILHGVIKSGRFAYINSQYIRGTFTFVVGSTFNAAKRRLVTVSGLVSIPRRGRSNLRPPSPRRRNGVIRQPPMTSNLARWEDELRARREESALMMQGVEPDRAGVSDYMMSGAIMDIAEDDCINPHYNPFYTPLQIDTSAFDACVRDIVHPNGSFVSFAANRNDGENGDLYMIDAEDLSAQLQSESVRQIFTDFSPFNLPNAVASSSSGSATYIPEHTFAPPFPANKSSASIPTTAIGATDSDASGWSQSPAESMMPKPQQGSIGSTDYESLMSVRIDDTFSDLSDDTEPQELPPCNFHGDNEQSFLKEIQRAANANAELRSDDSIASDDAINSSSVQAEISTHAKSTAPLEAVLASNVTQLPHSLPVNAPAIQCESHQTLSISPNYPIQIQTEGEEDPSSPAYSQEDEGVEQVLSRSSHFDISEQSAPSVTSIAGVDQHDISPLRFTPTHGFEQDNFPLLSEQSDKSIPISSVQILEQESSGQTTPTRNDGQQSPTSSVSPTGLPDGQSPPPSPIRSGMSLPATSTPNRKQWSPKSNMNTPKRIAKKSVIAQKSALAKKTVMFFESPKTGRPITKTKKYVLGESMDFPVSSSPAPNSVGSTEGSILEFDSPTTIVETEEHTDSFAQHDPSTPISPRHLAEEVAPKEEQELEIVNLAVKPSESAGVLTNETRTNGEVTLEVTGSVAGSLAVDSPSVELDKSATPEATSAGAGIRPAEADESTAESIGAAQTKRSSLAEADEPVIGRESPELTADSSLARADKPVIDKESTQETAGSSLGEADKPAEGEDVATDRNEPLPTIGGEISLRQLHDTLKLARPESSRRKSSPNRQPVQPARKSTRLQNKSAKVGPLLPAKMPGKSTVLGFSDHYGTTATTSKHDMRAVKAEQARLRQAAIQAAEAARRAQEEAEETARREAEEAEEKARVAKEDAEEKARKEKEEEEERQKRPTRRIPKEKVILPLTAEWEARVQEAMDTPDMRTVLVTLPSGTNLTRKDFGTLKVVPGRDPAHGWLNDEIILASLQQVVDYGLRMSNHEAGKTPKYHAFNTFFYKNLRDKGAQSIKRWATKAKIGGRTLEEVERVFIPVHQGAHWTLLVISPIARTIEYFDSMGGSADSYIRNAKLWLAGEMGARFKENEWAVPTGTHGVGPRQTNMSDCGVFTCTTARMVALGVDPMAYGGEDMGVQRGRMVAELLNGGLFGDFDPKVEF